MKVRGLRKVLATVLATVLITASAEACFMRSPQPVSVWLDHITVDITDQVAVKTYLCSFKNPSPRAIQGAVCYMELEPGAQVDNMSVLIDGKEMRAEILDVDKAKQVFNEIVKNGGSPALLEYYGNQLIQTNVPKIPANGMVQVKLTYTTVLKKRGDLVRLQMLNTNPKALQQPLKSAGVTVNIRSKTPIKNIYSPTHKINIGEKEDWDVSIKWSQENYLPKHPFVLYYQLAEEQLGASLIAHREEYEDGTFMLMLSPTVGSGTGKITDDQILPKDVVFCVDTSASMIKGKKMQQAREALIYCIKSLRDGDRFNIVSFSSGVRSFNQLGLVEVNDKNRARGIGYVNGLYAGGSTAIQDALDRSLKMLDDPDRLKMILFATDGLPTIGERDPDKILTHMAKANTKDVRLFVFGEGFDVNTKLLDFLAINHRGEADYIRPDEDIKDKIGHFFDRVGSPVMTDLKIEFPGSDVIDVYPRKVSDIYRGEQVIIYGRYSSHGQRTVELTGKVAGETKTFRYELDFPQVSNDDRSAFVPRLWAGKKVDFLLNEIRVNGTDKEIVDEVTDLAKQYGIVTPYTSYLVSDDVVIAGKKQLAQRFRSRLNAANPTPDGAGAPLDEKTRKDSVEASEQLADARRALGRSGGADAFYGYAKNALKAEGKAGSALSAIRYIGARTFYHGSDGVWYDSRYVPTKDKIAKTVKIASADYLKLMDQDSRLAKYFALGEVVVRIKQDWVRVTK